MQDELDKIHQSPGKGVIILTGGGTGVLPTLMKGGGASSTVISVSIPYTAESSYELLGCKPKKLVSAENTRALAVVAYKKAIKEESGPAFGVACSAVLQRLPGERVDRKHFIYVALQTDTKTISYKLDNPDMWFENIEPAQVRFVEESICEDMILRAVAKGCGQEIITMTDGMTAPHIIVEESSLVIPNFRGLVNDPSACHPILFDSTGNSPAIVELPETNNIFPGSFNPMHDGHVEVREMSEDYLDKAVSYELSITNFDKPSLDILGIEKRVKRLKGRGVLWITNAALFTEKSIIFPNATFIVGIDTAVRICEGWDNLGSKDFDVFVDNNVRFLVFPRETPETMDDCSWANLPLCFRSLATLISDERNYENLSSTSIRESE